MKAEIISVGTEILLGQITDTNANYLASSLPELGLDLYFITIVGDNLGRLSATVRKAHQRSDIVLMTGGLGPTEDDVTREAIADALGEETYIDEATVEHLRQRFRSRGISFPERNIKQAMLIPSARAIPNPRGTAPGWWVEKDGKIIIAMPGPPFEMERMWQEDVKVQLAQRFGGAVIVSRTLKTFGMGEGHVDELISPYLKSTNPTIGVYAKADGVHLRLTAKAATREEAQAMIEPLEANVRSVLGEIIWGVDDETLEGVVGELLQARGLTVATMESCSGGLLADAITNAPGASLYFKAGFTAYVPETKIALGVSPELIDRHGVVSTEVAADMARAARETARADIGVGVTGVAGPDPLEDKPPGTVHVAVHDGVSPHLYSFSFYQGRQITKRRAVVAALSLLRRVLVAQ
ncbi:MAG TPA: competence/damage-inducible protein A [Dehalococcoidia bacterium]|nr:competence/damage-inducible protein A [Dehalococcoidia bacterium]